MIAEQYKATSASMLCVIVLKYAEYCDYFDCGSTMSQRPTRDPSPGKYATLQLTNKKVISILEDRYYEENVLLEGNISLCKIIHHMINAFEEYIENHKVIRQWLNVQRMEKVL